MGSLPDKETVVLIFNLFFVGILLLTFIRGFMRGIRKSLFYTIFFTAGAVGLWFGIFALAPEIYTMDLSVFGLESSIQNEIFTTLVKDGEFTIEAGTYTYDAINGIAICVIQVALFLVGFVFWWLLYRVIIAIFWLIFGYPFLRVKKVKKPSAENRALAKTIRDSKQKRELLKPTVIRKKKHRLLGGVVGLVNGCAMCLAISVPIGGIFSIVTSATSSAKLLEEGTIPEEYVEYLEYGDVYDQTWMAKLLDNFGDNGLDNQMFDKLFNIQVNKTDSVKLRKEVTTLAKFAVRASESGILDVDTENMSLDIIKAIDETKLEESFATLNDLALLDVIYRIGVDFLEHSDFLTKDEQLKNLVINYNDFRNIKLSHDIANLGKLVCTTIDILQDQEDLENIDYLTLDVNKLNTFVEDLFNVELVNAGINTGLSYVLNLDAVVDFVGDYKVAYENINWKEDFSTIIEMYQEFVSLGIDFTSDESIPVQLLAENSAHLQNIINKLYSLDVFNEVKEIAVDFALTELEKNEDIAQYIPEEVFVQLKTNGSETLFTELSTIINLFKDLNEQTTLIKSLDEYLASEDEDAKFNLDVDPKLVYILADYIDASSIAEPVVLNFAELSNDSLKEDMGIDIHKALLEVEHLSDELRVVGHVLEGIEAEGGDLNKIISDLSSGNEIQEIDLALIKGIVNEEKAAYHDDNDIVHYYVDESKLLKTLMGPMLDNAMNGLLNGEEVFASDEFEWSKEIKVLSDLADVLARTTGTEGKLNIAELESTLSNKIHIDVVASLRDNADDSILIEKFAIVALQETIDAETLNKIDSWSNELNAFHKVGSTLTDADGYLVIEDLSNMKVIKMATINAASTVANDSELIKYFFKQPLTDLGVNPDQITDWNEELSGLATVADTIAVEVDGVKVLDIEGIEDQLKDEIPLATLGAARDIFKDSNSTVIVRTLLADSLKDIVKEDGFFDTWTNEDWYKELSALNTIAATMANSNGNLVISELQDIKYIKVATINAASTVANDSTLAQHLFNQPLTDLGVKVDDITNWNEELSGLASVADTIALEVEGERVLDIEGLETQLENEIPVATITAARDIFKDAALDKSTVIVRTLLTDALKDTITEPNFFDGWANDNWYHELNALNTIAATMANSNGNLVISELQDIKYIKVETINAASTVANDSNLIRYFFKQPLTDLGVNVEEITNWNEELSGLASVADTIAIEVEGERVLDIEGLETQLENEIPVATLEAARDIFKDAPVTKSTVIVRTLLSDSLKDVITEPGFFDTWTNEDWYRELSALNTIAATMANSNGNLVMSELENLEYIKVETIEEASTVANDSKLVQHLFNQPLTDLGVNVDDITNWNEELAGLATVANTIAIEVEGERVLNLAGIEDQLKDEIPLATLEAARDIFKDAPVTKSTVIVRTLLADSLKDTITEPGFFDNWENDDWHRELSSLVDVADTLSTNDKLVVADLTNMEVIYIKTLDSMKKPNATTSQPNIDSSKMLQYMARQGFAPVIGEDKVALIGTGNNPTWSEEITAIGAMVDGNTYKDGNNQEYIRVSEDTNGVELTIDKVLTSDDSSKVKWSIINTSSNYVENSLVLQTILEDPFKTILEEDELDWDGARWKLEVTAIADVTYELQDNDGFISMSLETNKIPVSVLESASENTLSLVIRKMMSDMLTPMYDAQDASQVPATWDDNRWEGEIEALTAILSTLKDSNNEIDISVSFLNRHVKLEMFDEMEVYINHSTVLQSKIAAEVYTEAGVRLLGTPEVMYGSEEWHNEMIAIDAILHTVDKDSDGNVSYESLDFDNIKIASLKVARDNIDSSIFIQHKMYISLDGIKLVDSSSLGKQVNYASDAEKRANSQWYNEVDALIEVAKDYFNVDDNGTIDLQNISFSTGLKTSIVGLLRENINHSTFLQDKLNMSLFASYSVKPIVEFTFEENQWNEELIALYDVVVALFGANSTISNTAINSALTNGFPVDALEALAKDIHRSLYLQNQLQSKLLAMAPSAYYTRDDIAIALPTAANNYNANWTNDVTALYVVMSKVSTGGNVQFDLSFTDTIDFGLLEVLVDNTNGTPIIGTSKLLQALLKDTIDGLNTLDQTRVDVMSSEFYGFEMKLGYEGTSVAGESWTVTEQWISELTAIIEVAATQVDSNNQIKLSEVNLDNLNKDLLGNIITLLDASYATSYGLPRIVRALLIPALESISSQGVTFDSNYNWASHDDVTSDLQHLYDVFEELGINNISECNKNNPNISLIKASQIVTEYQNKSVLVKAIFNKIVSEIMG